MMTLREIKRKIQSDPDNWRIHLMDFVDDFRFYKDPKAISVPFESTDDRMDALLASTTEYLCDELVIPPPQWILKIPACKYPWFVSEMESLKAIAIVESPLHFRIRKIFVLENFLSRI